MDRQRERREEFEQEKRNLAFSPSTAGGSTVGSGARRRINFTGGDKQYDSPRSGYSGSSSMYTDEKGLMVGIGGVAIEGNRNHMLLGGDGHGGGTQFAVPQQNNHTPQPIDLLDDDNGGGGGINQYGTIIQQTPSQGEMSV